MPKVGWKSPYTGKTFEQGDPAIRGRGMPPSCPDFASENPGAGNMRMERVVIDEEEAEAEAEGSTEAEASTEASTEAEPQNQPAEQ